MHSDPSEPGSVLMREATLAFGPFQLYPLQKVLLHQGERVRLGGRAIDLLLALARRPGQLLSQRALLAEVWPHTVVAENSLRVHVAALRRALRTGAAGCAYIKNVPGRGYAFLAPVVLEGAQPDREDTCAHCHDARPGPWVASIAFTFTFTFTSGE